MKTLNVLLTMAVLALGATQLSCSVNDYCLNCETGDGGLGSGDGDARDGGGDDDAPPDASCVPSGSEICDGDDNDCNGLVDDGVLPMIGDLCANQLGVCAGGTKICDGGEIKCDKTGSPEVCDGLDNNCNGTPDEGDPGGGGKCGTEQGECVAGNFRCQATTGCNPAANCTTNCCVVCIGFIDKTNDPEACNGRDDNCNGMLDEGITGLGACTWPNATNTGECNIGSLSCSGGATQCTGAVFPKFELCNSLDDDCDAKTDEVFNKNTDPNNCMNCGTVCPTPSNTCINSTNNGASCTSVANCTGTNAQKACVANSQRRCTGGACSFQCNVGFINLDGQPGNGCEYRCSPTGNEECDGVDNNCNGTPDEGVTAPPICLGGGECSPTGSTTPPTAVCSGAGGWTCTYPGNVQFPETRCDGLNNDCDANIDESQPNKGQACDDGQFGACRDTGVFVCNTTSELTRNGPAVCNAVSNGIVPGAVAESCNGIDDDCDGTPDDGGATGNLVGQEWVDVGGGWEMMKYEASKPDATATTQGTTQVLACSRPDVLPWTNITYPQAVAACASIGATLCTEQTWHRACSAVTSTAFPLAVATTGTLLEAEDYSAIAHATGGTPSATRSWAVDYTLGFSSISAMEAVPNTATGSATAGTGSPRLSYSLTFATASANYHIWVRLHRGAFNTGSDSVHVAVDSGAAQTASLTAATACSSNAQCTVPGTTCTDENSNGVVDTCTGWVWADAGTFNITAAAHTVNVYMAEDGTKIDQVYIVDGTGIPPQSITTKGNTWAFATSPNDYSMNVTTCNGDDLDTDAALAGDQDDTLATGSKSSCFSTISTDVFDLSGNVKEWTLAHQPGENPIRGGASNNTGVGISCPLAFTLADDSFFFPNIGFRCCR